MNIIKIGEKRSTPKAEALIEADRLINELRPFSKQIALAGSLLRDHDEIGDIDIVLVPSAPLPKISSSMAINLFITEEEFFEPCFLHYAIGKAIIRLKSVAKSKGWKLDQEGLHKPDQNVTSIVEIYNALGQKAPEWLLEAFFIYFMGSYSNIKGN